MEMWLMRINHTSNVSSAISSNCFHINTLLRKACAGFAQECIDVETVGRSTWPEPYKKDIVEILQMQVLLAWMEDVRSCHHLNGRGAAWHHVNSKWFEKFGVATAQRAMFSRKPNVNWKDKESNVPQSAMGLV